MSDTNNLITKLIAIQSELKVPKTRLNSFAKKPFNYRNAEDILSAAKPICHKHGCALYLDDDVVMIGDRYYIKATATLDDGTDTLSVCANARECTARSGFDEAQLSGSASSYARKYALNGLFGLDDNEDPDSKDNSQIGGNVIVCPKCGGKVDGYKDKRTGAWHTPQQVLNEYDMCCECVKAARNGRAKA